MATDPVIAKYRDLILNHLPSGLAWPKHLASTLAALSEALAVEFSRIEQRVNDLLLEVDPLTANEMLSDWERLLGLPDPCNPNPESGDERRAQIIAAIRRTRGGQSRQFFIDLIKSFGFDITITEHRPFVAGSPAGDPLENTADWAHTWSVNLEEAAFFYFRAGLGSAGEPLVTFKNDYVQCLLNKLKPAHTFIIFTATEEI